MVIFTSDYTKWLSQSSLNNSNHLNYKMSKWKKFMSTTIDFINFDDFSGKKILPIPWVAVVHKFDRNKIMCVLVYV